MSRAAFGSIVMSRGVGRGPTELAAFDAALRDAGVANYNLLCLSSVIPPGSRIERRTWVTPAEHWGQRLYVVLSQTRSASPGQTVHAGIGWVQHADGGQGLFVELHDIDRERLSQDLAHTLVAMQQGRGLDLGPVHTEIASATCEGEPVCALVVAVYAPQAW
ncbi:pyruvoyl-dependent arginine decarboxylase [Variovorax sp. YR752]|uniref:pyruvoyl-dependent arginine decarboxylase n=1 Tax=Variovorax sp. YR752 TaxID=1884383 RepID=UPI003137FB24